MGNTSGSNERQDAEQLCQGTAATSIRESRPKERPPMMAVYVARSEAGYLKLGFSSNPWRRVCTLGFPSDRTRKPDRGGLSGMTLVYHANVGADAKRIEGLVHDMLRHKVATESAMEWYPDTPEMLRRIIQEIQSAIAATAPSAAGLRPNLVSFKGVTPTKNGRRWRAWYVNGKRYIYVGSFASPELAARARDHAAKLALGDRAKLNYPDAHGRIRPKLD
jgi:hypothetical protein